MVKKLIRVLLTLSFWCYLALLLYFLFFSERYGRTTQYTTYQYNLELFHEIKRFFKYREIVGNEYFLINVVGNVAAFVPFGFLVPVVLKECKKGGNVVLHYFLYFLFVSLLGFLFSLFVETLQLVTKVGCFDVDDLLLNTSGVIIGFIGYIIGKEIFSKFFKKKGMKTKHIGYEGTE